MAAAMDGSASKRPRIVNILSVDTPSGSRNPSPHGRQSRSSGTPLPGTRRASRASNRLPLLPSRSSTRSKGSRSTVRTPASGSYSFLTDLLNDVDSLLETTSREQDPFAKFNNAVKAPLVKALRASMSEGYHPVFAKMDAGLEPLNFTHEEDKEWPASVLHDVEEEQLERTSSAKSAGVSQQERRKSTSGTTSKEEVFLKRAALMDEDDDNDVATVTIPQLPPTAARSAREDLKLPQTRAEVQVSLEASAQDLAYLTKKIKMFEDAGDTKKAAATCMDAMKVCGEDPMLDRAFMQLIQKLAYTPASSSYPTQVLLLATARLMLGDDLTISYKIHRDKPLPDGKEAQGFIALFEADEVQDAGFRDLIMNPPNTDTHMLDASDKEALRSPRGAIVRIAVTKEADTVLLSSRFVQKEGKYILRYYHEDKSIWPVAQSNLVETFIPAVEVTGPEMVVCPVDLSLSCSFNPYKKRSPAVTEGDSVVVVPKRVGGVDMTFDVLPWSGNGSIPIKGWPVLPGTYEANYISVLSGNKVMGKHTFKTRFGDPTGNAEKLREVRLCLATEVDAKAEVLLIKRVQKSLVRISEYMQLAFSIEFLSAEIADPPSPFGLLSRSFRDIDMSLPYFVSIFTHHYGFLPGQGAPEKPKPPPPAPAPAPAPKKEETDKEKEAQTEDDGAKKPFGVKGLIQKKVMQIARNQALFGAATQAVSADKIMNEGKSSPDPKPNQAPSAQPTRGRADTPSDKQQRPGSKSASPSKSPSRGKQRSSTSPDRGGRSKRTQKVKLEDATGGEITQVTRILTLRKSALLKAMSTAEVRSLATSSVMLKLAQGSDLIVAGNISGSMYVVVSGKFSVLIAAGKVEVAVLGPGDMVGEMSLLTGEPASATVRAKEDTSVLQITKAKIVDFLRTRPAFRAHLDAFMAERHAKNASILERMQENRRRVQEQDNIEDDGTTVMTTHPWVFEYYNSHIPQGSPSVLRASFFELQVAYAALLDPARATRCFSYQQDRALALASTPSQSPPSTAAAPPKHCEAVRGVKADKAAYELSGRAKQVLQSKTYKTVKQIGWMVMTDIGGALVQDFGYVLGYLEAILNSQEQLIRAHGGPQYSRDLQKRFLQGIDDCSKVILITGPPASGKTHLVCDAISKLRTLAATGAGRQLVDLQSRVQRLREGKAEPQRAGEAVSGELFVSLSFAQHYVLGVDSFRQFLCKLVEELRAAFGWDRAIPTSTHDLKAELLRMVTAMRNQAQIVVVVDSAHLLKSFDYEWLARISQHCPAGVCFVLTHDSGHVPPRLQSLATESIKLEESHSLLADMASITADFLESKGIPQLFKSLESLYEHPGAKERMSPGRFRMVLEYAIFNHTQTAGNYTIPVESMAKTLTLADRQMLHQAVAKGLDSKYRINGDILRFLAVVRSGLTAVEVLGLMALKYADKLIRISKLRDELQDNGILVLISGVFDFSCTALRTAAHHLFYDARERGNYILMVKDYFEAFSPRSPRRLQVLGQLCIDMHANRMPFIPLINAQAQHIYQSILADVNKTRKRHPTAEMDWLGILIQLVEEPLSQVSAGLLPHLAPQMLDLFAFASGAAEKEAARVRDGVDVLLEARSWGAKGAQVEEMLEGLEGVYRELLMQQEWYALRELRREELATAGSQGRPGTKPDTALGSRTRSEGGSQRPVIKSWAGEDEGEELIGEEEWDELDMLSFASDCICMSQFLAQLDSRSGSQKPLELLINSMYGLSSMKQLDMDCHLLEPWMAVRCFEARILAFAADICIQRWKQQRSAILKWAVDAARICSSRLNMPAATSATVQPGEEPHPVEPTEKTAFVKSEGAKLQDQKAVLKKEAEDVMEETNRFARKLGQVLGKVDNALVEDEFFIDDVDLAMTLDENNKIPAKFEDVKIRCLLTFSRWSPEAQMEALQSTLVDQQRFSGALGLEKRVDIFQGMALSKREQMQHWADTAMRRWLLFNVQKAFSAWREFQSDRKKAKGKVRHHIFEGVAKAKVAFHQLHERHNQTPPPPTDKTLADVISKARRGSSPQGTPQSGLSKAAKAFHRGGKNTPTLDAGTASRPPLHAVRPRSTEPRTPQHFHLPALPGHADHRTIKTGLASPYMPPRRVSMEPSSSPSQEGLLPRQEEKDDGKPSDDAPVDRPSNVFLFSTGRDGATTIGQHLQEDSD